MIIAMAKLPTQVSQRERSCNYDAERSCKCVSCNTVFHREADDDKDASRGLERESESDGDERRRKIGGGGNRRRMRAKGEDVKT